MDLNFDLTMTIDGGEPGAAGGGREELDVLVVGGGPAGATAALYAARAGLRTLVVDKGLGAGALGLTARIANYPGIPGELTGAELVARMRVQAESFGARFVQDKIQAADLSGPLKSLWGNAGTYTARVAIIATGAMGRGQRVPGEDALLGRGVSYCATCDAAFFRDQEVAVAGSNGEALEEALFLTRFVRRVHLLVPTPELKAPAELAAQVSDHPRVTVYRATALRAVLGQERVAGVRIAPRGGAERVIPVAGAFIYLQGGRPITDFLGSQLETSPAGCVLVDREFRTSLPDVFAVGDVLCEHVKQAVVAAAEGAVAAMAAEKALHGRRRLAVDWA
jgi:thioredoxin reductase (NADPH)